MTESCIFLVRHEDIYVLCFVFTCRLPSLLMSDKALFFFFFVIYLFFMYGVKQKNIE